MEARKRIIIRTGIIFICVLLIITFFSSTIYTFNLPSVTLSLPRTGSTVQVISGSGFVELTEKNEISAIAGGIIVFSANIGDTVLEGETLYTILPSVTEEEIIEMLRGKEAISELYDLRIENVDLRISNIKSKLAAEPNNDEYILAESDLALQRAMLLIEKESIEDEIRAAKDLSQEIIVLADKDCIIIEYPVQSGSYVSKNTGIMATGKTETVCKVNMLLPASAAQFISEQMIVLFDIPSKDTVKIQGIVESVSDENGMLSALIRFNGKGLSGGELAVMKMEKVSAKEDYIVPNTAITAEDNGHCVYTVERRANPIGYDYVLRSVSVKILSSDDLDSAISPLSGEDLRNTPIVINSDRVIFRGSRVQLADGSDYVEAR